MKRALDLSRGCGPTQVTIAKAELPPAVSIEKTDGDKDGVPDLDDRCPTQPGPKESQGCRSRRTPTRTGSRTTSIAALDPEDRDGFQDEDGCPDADNDGDGIVDKADQCPLEPGAIETRGCPVQDKDGDGVVDRQTRAPTSRD